MRSFSVSIEEFFEDFENPWVIPFSLIATLIGILPQVPNWFKYIVFVLFLLSIAWGFWRKRTEKKEYMTTGTFIPIVINVANTSSIEDAQKKLINSIETEHNLSDHDRKLATYLDITKDDLVFKFGSDNDDIYNLEKLNRFLAVVRYRVNALQKRCPQNMMICLAYAGPTSVGVALGTLFTNSRATIYQYSKDHQRYKPVLKVDRKSRENIPHVSMFDLEFYGEDKDGIAGLFDPSMPKSEKSLLNLNGKVNLAIDASTHKIGLNHPSLIRFSSNTIHMVSKGTGTIQDGEWEKYSADIFFVLNTIQQYFKKPQVRMIHSMPNSLGIVIGISVQNYWDILVTNYEKSESEYRDVFNLKDIDFTF